MTCWWWIRRGERNVTSYSLVELSQNISWSISVENKNIEGVPYFWKREDKRSTSRLFYYTEKERSRNNLKNKLE